MKNSMPGVGFEGPRLFCGSIKHRATLTAGRQAVAILVLLTAAACDRPSSTIDAYFAQSYTVPSDRSVVIAAIQTRDPACKWKGSAKYNPATERVDITFIEKQCAGKTAQAVSGMAIDQGAEVLGVYAECTSGKESPGPQKPWICLEGRVQRHQAFIILRDVSR